MSIFRTFDNIGLGSYQLFILLSTENYPVSLSIGMQYAILAYYDLQVLQVSLLCCFFSLHAGIHVSCLSTVWVVLHLLWLVHYLWNNWTLPFNMYRISLNNGPGVYYLYSLPAPGLKLRQAFIYGRRLLVCRCSTLVSSINFTNQLQMYDT